MPSDRPQRLLVAVVNYRVPELVVDCLRSLDAERESVPELRVVVVDGGSGDNSAELIGAALRDEKWDGWAELRALSENRGFAFGNDAAIAPALASDEPPDFVLLLNPDTVVRPGAVSALLAFMRAHPEAGIAGSRLEHPDGEAQVSAFRFPSALGEFEGAAQLGPVSRALRHAVVPLPVSDDAHRCDWVAGASMIVRREVFDDIGAMDDRYFLYFEEVDFCLRAARAGWSCWYAPQSRVVHLVGKSSGISSHDDRPRRRPAYWFESRRRFFVQNHGAAKAVLADLAFVAGALCERARTRIGGRADRSPPHFLADFLRGSTLARGFALPRGSDALPLRAPGRGRVREPGAERAATMSGAGEGNAGHGSAGTSPGLWELIREDWIAHERDWTRPGFRAVAVHRFGRWRMGVRSRLLRAPLSVLYRMLFRRVRNRYGIELPYGVELGRRVVIEHQGAIVVHGCAVIGDECILRQGVTIGNRSLEEALIAPTLGRGVNVGAGAKILGGVAIGDGAAIGANAVVLRDVPAGATAVGVPARLHDPRGATEHGGAS